MQFLSINLLRKEEVYSFEKIPWSFFIFCFEIAKIKRSNFWKFLICSQMFHLEQRECRFIENAPGHVVYTFSNLLQLWCLSISSCQFPNSSSGNGRISLFQIHPGALPSNPPFLCKNTEIGCPFASWIASPFINLRNWYTLPRFL